MRLRVRLTVSLSRERLPNWSSVGRAYRVTTWAKRIMRWEWAPIFWAVGPLRFTMLGSSVIFGKAAPVCEAG